MAKAVFLDRDGVLNQDNPEGYVRKPEEFILLPGVLDALRLIQSLGYKLIIVTNQSGVGRNYYTLQDMHNVHDKMHFLMKEASITLDGLYFCPHAPEERCLCRKPETAMLEQAKEDHQLDLTHSVLIGDKTSDIEAGRRVGCKTILVKTGYGGQDGRCPVEPDIVVKNLWEAAQQLKQETLR